MYSADMSPDNLYLKERSKKEKTFKYMTHLKNTV